MYKHQTDWRDRLATMQSRNIMSVLTLNDCLNIDCHNDFSRYVETCFNVDVNFAFNINLNMYFNIYIYIYTHIKIDFNADFEINSNVDFMFDVREILICTLQ